MHSKAHFRTRKLSNKPPEIAGTAEEMAYMY